LGCTLTALSCDAARQPDEVKVEFEEGIEQLIQLSKNINSLLSQLWRFQRHLFCSFIHNELDKLLNALFKSCDAARQPDEVKVEFEEGIEQLIQFIMNERAKQVSLEHPKSRLSR
jgi:TetR/AcrR family transcriptional repressor of nem operon